MEADLYFDTDPAKYVRRSYDRALAVFKSQQDRTQENWDMFMGYDQYIEERRSTGKSALSFPLIFPAIEARVATMLEVQSSQNNLIEMEPINDQDPMARIAAERLQDAFQHMRADLDWDQKLLDLFQACEIFDWNWIGMGVEELQMQPHHALVVQQEMYGTEKTYPSWQVYHPGAMLADGDGEHSKDLVAKFKQRWLSYDRLKKIFPDKVDNWILRHSMPKDESNYFNPAESQGDMMGADTVYWSYSGDGGGGDNASQGFLVVEGHLRAVFSDGMSRDIVYTFLPQVKESPNDNASEHGYQLEVRAEAFQNLQETMWMATGRSLPFTMYGKGTADLLVPFQRDFSDQISTERDYDRLLQAPPIAVRSELLLGREEPSMDPYELWHIKADHNGQLVPLRDAVMPIHVPTPNRSYAVDTREKIQNLMDLISAAMEATTGMDPTTSATATEFSGRARGAARRINLVFNNHANTLRRIVRSMLVMMQEAPQEFLYPHMMANSATAGQGVLTPQHVAESVRVRVPALTEYANKEMAKVMWRMVSEGLMQMPVVQGSPEAQVFLAEQLMRTQQVSEMQIEEFKGALYGGIQQAAMMGQQGMNPVIGGGGAPAPGGGGIPGVASGGGAAGVAKGANLSMNAAVGSPM